ncbi:MAG: hypothetical protein OXB89_00485 [Anaerolineaceae bacterium]|nr:hypothetical protein [Anaerolineaceae bacterium]
MKETGMMSATSKAQVLRIATARINHKAASDERVLDITRKSASEEVGRLMAPEWRMVLDLKEERIDWATYTGQYQDLLRKRYARYAQAFHDLIRDVVAGRERLVLTCYCNVGPDCNHCHRFLMADILEKIARQEGYDVSREDDLSRNKAPETSPQLPLGF